MSRSFNENLLLDIRAITCMYRDSTAYGFLLMVDDNPSRDF